MTVKTVFWLGSFTAALITTCCRGDGGVEEIPLVSTPMDAATVIDVPSTVVDSRYVSREGETIITEDATLTIPPEALASATKIEITRIETSFNMNPYAADEPDAVSAVPIGWAVDFGPAGVSFDKPVTVTIPYDPDALTEKHDKPALAYWNGAQWSLLESSSDRKNHTVSVNLSSFDGIVLEVIAVGTVVSIWSYVAVKWFAHDDPIIANKAAEYVTPNEPIVETAASLASIDGFPISDETNLASYLESLNGGSARVSLGTLGRFSYAMTTGANWQKPADYLSDNPTGQNYEGAKALGQRRGDCTDTSNAVTSMFRALGYKAMSVFGYIVDKESPHVWTEVIVGGVPYIVDERGTIQRLDKAITAQKIIRPDADDERNFMWNETGQVPYREEWWKTTEENMGPCSGAWNIYAISTQEGLVYATTEVFRLAFDNAGGFTGVLIANTVDSSFSGTYETDVSYCYATITNVTDNGDISYRSGMGEDGFHFILHFQEMDGKQVLRDDMNGLYFTGP